MHPTINKVAAFISTQEEFRIPILVTAIAAAIPINQKRTENDRSFYFSPFWTKIDGLLSDLNELVLINPSDCQKEIQACWEARVRDLDTPFTEWRNESAWDKALPEFTPEQLNLCSQIQLAVMEFLGA